MWIRGKRSRVPASAANANAQVVSRSPLEIGDVSPAARYAVLGAVVLFVGLLMKWYETSGAGARSWSGWHSVTVLRAVIVLTVLLVALAAALPRVIKGLDLPAAPALTLLGGAVTVWILARLLAHPIAHSGVKLGLFVALVGAVLVMVGERQVMDEEGASFGDIKRLIERWRARRGP
jgi:hypothetical protein